LLNTLTSVLFPQSSSGEVESSSAEVFAFHDSMRLLSEVNILSFL